MAQYVGTKVINAKPMTRQEYNDFRNCQLPPDKNGEDEGYLIEYVDGGKANTTAYSGYISWSPKDVFNKTYRPNGNLTFGDAIMLCKAGCRVARAGWNGKGMWIFLSTASTLPAYLTVQDTLVPWFVSQSDILAEDWCVLED
ncbi:MAG: DUF2829 domain-containing protein [Sulfurimonas sp.]|uniref:DUF2829 domain-containing protein n=1 Tax=Sulfurimonas sp. TaxID=2022749 RepID=UPI003D1314F9